MNPMAQESIASVIRWVLAIGAGYLVKAGIWTEGDATGYVSAAALALVALGWSQYQAYVARQKLVTALATPTVMSERQLETRIASGVVASVTTPKDA